MSYPEVFVLRHGQTQWNLAGRHQGRLDSPLTALGRSQATDQGCILLRATAGRQDLQAASSPQGRALATATIALDPLDIVPTQDERLCEISFGEWEGMTALDIEHHSPELAEQVGRDMFHWHMKSPGGEDFDQIYQRAQSFLETLDGPTIIVTHGILSRVLRGIWLGLDADGMADLPGGQGCVYHLVKQSQTVLTVA